MPLPFPCSRLVPMNYAVAVDNRDKGGNYGRGVRYEGGPACYGHVRAQSVQLIPMVDVSLSKLVAVRKMWPCVV